MNKLGWIKFKKIIINLTKTDSNRYINSLKNSNYSFIHLINYQTHIKVHLHVRSGNLLSELCTLSCLN